MPILIASQILKPVRLLSLVLTWAWTPVRQLQLFPALGAAHILRNTMSFPCLALEEVRRLFGAGHERHLVFPTVPKVVFVLHRRVAVGWVV